MPEDINNTPLPDDQNPAAGDGNQDNNIPDWMKEAGWEESSGVFDESKPVFDGLDDDEEQIVPADIPAWLEEAAPEGFNFEIEAEQDSSQESQEEPFSLDDYDFGDTEEPVLESSEQSEPDPQPVQQDEDLDVPSWLENLELDEDSQETAVAWLENMPESLRATEEELRAAEEIPTQEPEDLQEPTDDLAWMDELPLQDEEEPETESEAALSEELIASNLIPETDELGQIFAQEDLESVEDEVPSWLKELGTDQDDLEPSEPEQMSAEPEQPDSMVPDWLSELDEPEPQMDAAPDQEAPSPDSTGIDTQAADDIPAWLGDLEGEESSPEDLQEPETLQWLDELAGDSDTPAEAVEAGIDGAEDPSSPVEPSPTLSPETSAETASIASEHPQESGSDSVSPDDDTLNTQIPDWLSKIGEDEGDEITPSDRVSESPEQEPSAADEVPSIPAPSESQFDESASWLDQLGDTSDADDLIAQGESDQEVAEWLDSIAEQPPVREESDLNDLRDSLTQEASDQQEPPELETAQYLQDQTPPSEDVAEPDPADISMSESEDLPDWLSELSKDQPDDPVSLEDAIRQSDHDLNEAEQEFLERNEEIQKDNDDWLSKLDEVEEVIEEEEVAEAEEIPPATQPDDPASGILDRLKEESDQKDSDPDDTEIPQWLENLKKEEDPQETAVLWLQEFLDKGNQADIKTEIERYTDELDPGDNIPKWMEDLKNEEDPQTTAMLWLEKLSRERSADEVVPAPREDDDQSDWLAELEKEEASKSQQESAAAENEFDQDDGGWLEELEIDEKLKTADEDLGEWTSDAGQDPEAEEEGEPSWMKATSPLEGDFYTGELDEEEAEIPEWLAGYAEGERPDESQDASADGASEVPEGSESDDEYAWLSAEEVPQKPRELLDLNKAAISQLEAILGISYQVAKGIVQHREKHGPFYEFSDLMNVEEIVDAQTIEILKPEVFIDEVKPVEPTPKPEKKAKESPEPAKKSPEKESFEEILAGARTNLANSELEDALSKYGKLIEKKKFLQEIAEDLNQASLDHPLEIGILKSLGDAYMQSDMLDEALEAYSKAEDLLG